MHLQALDCLSTSLCRPELKRLILRWIIFPRLRVLRNDVFNLFTMVSWIHTCHRQGSYT